VGQIRLSTTYAVLEYGYKQQNFDEAYC